MCTSSLLAAVAWARTLSLLRPHRCPDSSTGLPALAVYVRRPVLTFLTVGNGERSPWATFCLPSAVMSAASQRGPTVNYHSALLGPFLCYSLLALGSPAAKQCLAGPRPKGRLSPSLPLLLTGASIREAEISCSRLMLDMHYYLHTDLNTHCTILWTVCGGRLARLHVSQTGD